MSGLSDKLRICDDCYAVGVPHEIAGAPGAFYLSCQTSNCKTQGWYACGLCKAAYLHYKAETNADRAKFAQHLKGYHKITTTIQPTEPRETKRARVASRAEPMVTTDTETTFDETDSEEEDELSADGFPDLPSGEDDDSDVVEGAEPALEPDVVVDIAGLLQQDAGARRILNNPTHPTLDDGEMVDDEGDHLHRYGIVRQQSRSYFAHATRNQGLLHIVGLAIFQRDHVHNKVTWSEAKRIAAVAKFAYTLRYENRRHFAHVLSLHNFSWRQHPPQRNCSAILPGPSRIHPPHQP